MTTAIPGAHQAAPLVESTPARAGRAWAIAGTLAALVALGYAAFRLAPGMAGEAAPAPIAAKASDNLPALAAPEPEARNLAAAPASEDEESDRESPAPASTISKDGAFHVQVASYKDEKDAAEYAKTLSARGLAATASPDPEGASWHSVRLGPFQSRAEAEKSRFQLKLREREKAFVMPRSNGKYHVQIGSFATREKADSVAQRYGAQGHVTKISRIKMGDRRWHCVRIGPFDTEQEAADYRELVKESAPESVVIPYGPPKG